MPGTSASCWVDIFSQAFGVGDLSGFRVLHGFGKDERRRLFPEDDSQDNVAVFDAEREVRTVFENLFRRLVGANQEVDLNLSERVEAVFGVDRAFGNV